MTPKAVRELGKTPFVASQEKTPKGKACTGNALRNDALERLRQRYAGRGSAGEGRLLEVFCEHHGYKYKEAIKLLQAGPARPA